MSAHPATTGGRIVTGPAYDRWGVTVYEGDCLDVLRQFPDEHFAAVVTDPPYSYRFMGRSWDAHESPLAFQRWCEGWARECLRVLKPGGMMLAFGGTRTFHRLTCGIEDAGFEIRDSIDSVGASISWTFAGGMPKGINISKAIDRVAGSERSVIGRTTYADGKSRFNDTSIGYGGCDPAADTRSVTAPATDEARQWEGWNTQLRPAHEPIVVARKPFPGTVAGNVLAHGTGGINVDACRVAMAEADADMIRQKARPNSAGQEHIGSVMNRPATPTVNVHSGGRWPPNVVLSHVPSVDPATGEVVGDACAQGCVDGCPVRELDQQSGVRTSGAWNGHRNNPKFGDVYNAHEGREETPRTGDSGGASRFFSQCRYTDADGTPTTPNVVPDGLPVETGDAPCFIWSAKAPTAERPRVAGESHSTVKPLSLIRFLVRLCTPPGGIVLDCFAGTGTTGQATRAEGFRAVLIDSDPAAIPWIVARLDAHPREDKPTTAQPAARQAHPDLFEGAAP